MRKVLLVFAIAVAAGYLACSQTNASQAKKSPLEGTWELISGQPPSRCLDVSYKSPISRSIIRISCCRSSFFK